MNDDKGSTVVSVRIAPALLRAVRALARAEGRSTSGKIVSILRAQVEAEPATPRKSQPITGWLHHLDVPENHEQFRQGRHEASARLLRAVAGPPRRRRPQ
jgi:hypothetical protein